MTDLTRQQWTMPTSGESAMLMAKMIANSQACPKDYRGKPHDVIVAIMMGAPLGLNPMQCVQGIAVINGRPTIYGDSLVALVQNHPDYDGYEDTFDEDAMASTVTVRRRGKPSITRRFSKADAERAGLWDKAGPWRQYPPRMLFNRARTFAFRDAFADALQGLHFREEVEDCDEDVRPADAVRIRTSADAFDSAVGLSAPAAQDADDGPDLDTLIDSLRSAVRLLAEARSTRADSDYGMAWHADDIADRLREQGGMPVGEMDPPAMLEALNTVTKWLREERGE